MPSFCAVVNCAMRGNRDDVRFFRIPAALQNSGDKRNLLSRQRREAWISALERGPLSENQLKYTRICSRHFISGVPADLEDTDNLDWIPNQHMKYILKEELEVEYDTQSHQDTGSPFSNAYGHDDYEFEDDKYDDNERENIANDESDEDTEEASETEMSRHEEPYEIKEQMYQDKLASLKKKLQHLKDGTHSEYNRKVKKLESQYKERIKLNVLYRDYMIECVERDYIKEKKAAAKEFEEKKVDLKENLLSDFEDKRRTIEAERYSLELTGDSMEMKPVMTRKLRRRPNDPAPVPEKRRNKPIAPITFLLDEKEIENDMKVITRGKILTPIRKPGENTASTTVLSQNQSNPIAVGGESPLVDTRIEDGKLLYERRWFHRGQSIYVEGRDMPKFPASISAIGTEAICVKKSDGTKVRIYVSNLARGKIAIKRRAS